MEQTDLIGMNMVPAYFQEHIWLLLIVMAWIFAWKGTALWKAVKRNELIWFVILLIVNTMGILEILYIFVFSRMNFSKTAAKNKR